MNLFHETKNSVFLKLIEIANRIHRGDVYSYKRLRDEIIRCFSTPEAQYPLEEALTDALFDTSDPTAVRPRLPLEIPLPPCRLEKEWLLTYLHTPAAAAFLGISLRDQLSQALLNCTPLYSADIWTKETEHCGDDLRNEHLRENVAIALTALRKKKRISYSNHAATDAVYEETASPYKLEYSLKENKYRLIVWNNREQRAVKINLANLSDIHMLDESIASQEQEAAQKFMEQRRRQKALRLRVHDKQNAVERCFSIFSCYDKEAYIDNDAYILEISFHDFDRTAILCDILSLGSAVTVESPESIRKEIVNILKQSHALYDL